jgi:hypothetical protein
MVLFVARESIRHVRKRRLGSFVACRYFVGKSPGRATILALARCSICTGGFPGATTLGPSESRRIVEHLPAGHLAW